MKLSCLQENLSRGLAIVGRAVASRTTLPITQNVLLVADESRLKLSATNLEIAISTWVGAKVEEEGSITIPARLLTEFVNSLPSERIDIETREEPPAIHLQCGRFDAQMNGTDPNDFPPLPTVDGEIAAKIDPRTLHAAISQVSFVAATEESRPVLTGIKVEFQEDQFTFAAADGFRLAVRQGPLAEPVSESSDLIIPARTLSELNRLLGDQDEPVEFKVTSSQNQVLIRLRNVEMVSQLTQGKFPNYSQLIPAEYSTRAIVGLREFLRATRTASIFARDGSGIIRLQFFPGPDSTPGSLEVASRAEEMGENKGSLDARIEGPEARIAFSSRYLSEVLNAIEGDEVVLDTTTPSSPGVFRPVGSDNYTHVVMPMFVQW